MADLRHCIAIKADGEACGKRCTGENTRCGTHLNTIRNRGPNEVARQELSYIHKKTIRDIELRYVHLIAAALNHNNHVEHVRLLEDERNDILEVRARQRREMTELVRQQQDNIRDTGVDPDRIAREQRADRVRRFREQRMVDFRVREQQGMVDFRFRREEEARDAIDRVAAFLGQEQQRPPQRELERFAQDNQNVHTSAAVRQTKDIVDRILKIPIPDEYKWNMRVCSKTPGEIITTCSLTPKGAWQMSSKYCQDENIYELGHGVYGKVLDGVWQYILNSPDKSDLCRILRQEMEDNIGMCAQGNLSRLCNILSGYMEGIGSQESLSDILGRLLPKTMEIEDIESRLSEAFRILKENGVPYSDWKAWLDPLLSDQDVETTVDFLYNERREITGIVTIIH